MKRHLCSFVIAGLLAAAPGIAGENSEDSATHRPVSSREIEQLNLQIASASRSSVEALGEYHTETGDVNERLDFWRYGGRFNYRHTAATLLYLRAVGTDYMTIGHLRDARGLNFTGGLQHKLSEATSAQFEIGATHFSTGASTVNATGTLRHQISDGLEFHLTGSRANVEETLLSAAGVKAAAGPHAGQLVGLVMDNRGTAGVHYQATRQLDFSAEGGLGLFDGRNVETNFVKAAGAGAGYNLLATPEDSVINLVRASYSLDYFGFDKDLSGFALQRAGGYFSPAAYVSNVARIELRGRPHPRLEYGVAGFLGAQDYTNSPVRQARGVAASMTAHFGERFSLPVTYVRDNFGPFTQQSLMFRLVARM